MDDLILGIAINLIVASLIGFAMRQLSRQWPLCWVDIAGLLVVACLLLYLVYVWDQLWQLRWLPFGNMIVLGNGLPLFISALGGLTCRRLKGRPRVRTRRSSGRRITAFTMRARIATKIPTTSAAVSGGRTSAGSSSRTRIPASCAA